MQKRVQSKTAYYKKKFVRERRREKKRLKTNENETRQNLVNVF